MSNLVTNLAKKIRTGSPTTKLVLFYLADRADDEGKNCYPAAQTISDETELGLSTVKKATKKLEELGFITKDRTGGFLKYQLNIEYMESLYGRPQSLPQRPCNHKTKSTSETPKSTSETPKSTSETQYINKTSKDINNTSEVFEDIKSKQEKKPKKPKHTIPDDFALGQQIIDLCYDYGINPDFWLDEFVSAAKAKDYKYINWQMTCKNWLLRKIERQNLRKVPRIKKVATQPSLNKNNVAENIQAGMSALASLKSINIENRAIN